MGLWGKKPAEPVRRGRAQEITKAEGVPETEPLPDAPKPPSSLDELVRQTVQAAAKPSAPDIVQLRDAARLQTEEIQKEPSHRQQETMEPPEPPPDTPSDGDKNSVDAICRPCGRTRNNELHFRFSDAELKRFQVRVSRSGLNQSEFIRRAVLTGRIVIEDRNPVNTMIMDDLERIRAELGRQGGMLKMVVKPNQGQRELHPEEWDELVQAIRYLEHTKERLKQLEDKINGDHHA